MAASANRGSSPRRANRARRDPADAAALDQLADPNSPLGQLWEQEHDDYVLRRLLELSEPKFEPQSSVLVLRSIRFGISGPVWP